MATADRFWRGVLATVSLLAGLSALPLLPIGMWNGTQTLMFEIAFILHAIFPAIAVIAAGLYLFNLLHSSALPVWLTLGSLAVFLALIVVQSLLPITARDALIHHLAVPRWWLLTGKIEPLPWHSWSFYPMLLQLGFSGWLHFGLEQVTPFYHGAFLLLLCANTAVFIETKSANRELALFGFILIFTIPICLRLAASPLVDLGLALFVALGLYTAVYWAEEKQSNIWLLACGLSWGLALGCKLNALLACGLFFPSMLVLGQRTKIKTSSLSRSLLVAGLLALALYSPWMLRNFSWTGNPFYPLFKSYFAETPSSWSPPSLSPLQQRKLLYGENLYEISALPLRIFFTGQDGNPKYFDGRLTPLLLLALPALAFAKRFPWVPSFFLFSLFYLLFALLVAGARIRYLAPLYGPLTALASFGLLWICTHTAPKTRLKILSLFLVLQGAYSLWYGAGWFKNSAALSYLFGETSKQEYLRSHVDEFRMIEYINQNLPAEALTYLLFTGNRFYYYNRPVISGGHFSASLVFDWIKKSATAGELLEYFKKRGIQYLMAHAARAKDSFQTNLNEREKQLWNEFAKEHLNLIHNADGYLLWRIN